ncbi:unnamed protein product [Dibothriocephalus latus]|uniref:Uncharacterized protein n=1 Tax=Dibothriocephalus latus TaxID=60516 RepID=A0A3P7LEM5_DIBLA|nr:unnamed protein product [Dibothriocephalus latus]
MRERLWRVRAPLIGRRQQHAGAIVRIAAAPGQEGEEQSLIGVFGGTYKKGETWTSLASCEVYDIGQNR